MKSHMGVDRYTYVAMFRWFIPVAEDEDDVGGDFSIAVEASDETDAVAQMKKRIVDAYMHPVDAEHIWYGSHVCITLEGMFRLVEATIFACTENDIYDPLAVGFGEYEKRATGDVWQGWNGQILTTDPDDTEFFFESSEVMAIEQMANVEPDWNLYWCEDEMVCHFNTRSAAMLYGSDFQVDEVEFVARVPEDKLSMVKIGGRVSRALIVACSGEIVADATEPGDQRVIRFGQDVYVERPLSIPDQQVDVREMN